MQGRGVIQYDVNKTSHAIGTATTQFDDELMKRKIVTAEQVYLAKGAKSLEEAQRLANERREQRKPQPKYVYDISSNQDKQEQVGTTDDDDDDEYDDLLDEEEEDDAFFARYRQLRLAQMKQESADQQAKHQSRQQQNMPTRIKREEWTTRVNQTSYQHWVLVILWDDSSMRTQDILQDLVRLQQEREQSDAYRQVQEDEDDSDSEDDERRRSHQYASKRIEIVTIEYQQANPHWPSARVPAIFAYRNGIKQHEWVTNQAGKFPTREQLQVMLLEWGI